MKGYKAYSRQASCGPAGARSPAPVRAGREEVKGILLQTLFACGTTPHHVAFGGLQVASSNSSLGATVPVCVTRRRRHSLHLEDGFSTFSSRLTLVAP